MLYVATQRAKFEGIRGPVNLPYGTEVRRVGDYLFKNGTCLCSAKSDNGRMYFSPNDDGNGQKRGELIRAIKAKLEFRDTDIDWQNRWNRIWGSLMCKRYQSQDHQDFWVWNQAFYEAPIEDLQSILAMISA